MATVKNFEDLSIWQRARELCRKVFLVSKENPEFKKNFALYHQINSSTGSIMDNIAEGFERDNNKEFINFLLYSKGSCGEARSQIYRMLDKEYIEEAKLQELKEHTLILSRSLSTMIHYLKKSEYKGQKFKEDPVIYNLKVET